MVEIVVDELPEGASVRVSVLYREPMWLKCTSPQRPLLRRCPVSVLYREPMWLKYVHGDLPRAAGPVFQCSTVSRCG